MRYMQKPFRKCKCGQSLDLLVLTLSAQCEVNSINTQFTVCALPQKSSSGTSCSRDSMQVEKVVY